MKITAKKPMLHKAHDLINGDRQEQYGEKLQNFSQIAMGFQTVLAAKLQSNQAITPEDVALLMMQLKIVRLTASPDHADSLLDIAGYAGCYSALQNDRAANLALQGATKDPRSY